MNILIGWLIALVTFLGGFIWLDGGASHKLTPDQQVIAQKMPKLRQELVEVVKSPQSTAEQKKVAELLLNESDGLMGTVQSALGKLWKVEEILVIFGVAFGTLIASNKWRNLKNLAKAFGRIFLRAEKSKNANLALLCLIYELLQKDRLDKDALLEHVETPATSSIFSKYPEVLNHHRLVEFICDYFQMLAKNQVTLSQLETVMAQEIDVLNNEALEPSDSMVTLADSMPAYGIVAAIVGVIHTLSSITPESTPGVIGEGIGAALVGTLLGVFSAYAIFSPVARVLEQNAASDIRPFEAVKEILIAYYSDCLPRIAVEYGRKVLYSDQRPSSKELDERVKSSGSNRNVD
jgi:chemotaxis protein MotA